MPGKLMSEWRGILLGALIFSCGIGAGWFVFGVVLATSDTPTPQPPSPTPGQSAAPVPFDPLPLEQKLESLETTVNEKTQALDDKLDSTRNELRQQDRKLDELGRIVVRGITQMNDSLRKTINSDKERFSRYVEGGMKYHAAGEFQRAISEFSKAIAIRPDDYGTYIQRGISYQEIGDWSRALSDYITSIDLNRNAFAAWNNLAWIEATCPQEEYRHGARALQHAMRACELTQWKNFSTLETLAAAYALSGDREAAVKHQKQAIELAPEKLRARLEEALATYENGGSAVAPRPGTQPTP